ncbi:hypothetical protein [Azospirillum aestuarii]|uniref:hypothetical protein n=1 Tax=Azospirillum aestuarii TaxID=2802052 RepID=UPI0040550A75
MNDDNKRNRKADDVRDLWAFLPFLVSALLHKLGLIGMTPIYAYLLILLTAGLGSTVSMNLFLTWMSPILPLLERIRRGY